MGAHVHVGGPAENGPVAVDLMDQATTREGRRRFSARGVITAARLTGPLAGRALSELVTRMTAGGTYVNVHTDDNAAPPDTGPGDFPAGEIRGQLRRLGRAAVPAMTNPPAPAPQPPTGGLPGY